MTNYIRRRRLKLEQLIERAGGIRKALLLKSMELNQEATI